MKWNDVCTVLAVLLQRFEDEQTRVPIGRAITAATAYRNVIRAESRTRRHVDALVRKLVAGHAIVNTPPEAYFLAQRFKYGLVIARAIATKMPGRHANFSPPKNLTRPELLSWLLTDVWRSTNRYVWRSILEGMLQAQASSATQPASKKL